MAPSIDMWDIRSSQHESFAEHHPKTELAHYNQSESKASPPDIREDTMTHTKMDFGSWGCENKLHSSKQLVLCTCYWPEMAASRSVWSSRVDRLWQTIWLAGSYSCSGKRPVGLTACIAGPDRMSVSPSRIKKMCRFRSVNFFLQGKTSPSY